ncbi:MAG: acyl-ACP--UDP-N-acetylglucosamine O-acyltransferase [Deltaproteobacteria bacterium]|nr:acyl-ACP--UDP-N-acetylglucosamine O-acyltransferase [Planctomycetota bacterium]MBI3782897.1 acyl-ACP--UDP-N-acetylglucosamine O-acyltransferase [Deltaproteobacteria bacterium]
MAIHPTAIVGAEAEIDASAEIGPYVVVNGRVRIGPRTRVEAHATLIGWTEIGSDNVIHAGAVIGDEPQDLSYDGAESYVRIGDRNVFREHVQIHRGTKPGTATEIGCDNMLMANAHVGHNCRVGNRIIIANGAALGGYVDVEDQVFISANCVVHQFVRIGRLALLRGLSRSSRDVPPFCIMDFTHTVRAINVVGLRRAGFPATEVRALRTTFAKLFGQAGNLRLRLEELEKQPMTDEVRYLVDFIRASKRGVCRGMRRGDAAEIGD